MRGFRDRDYIETVDGLLFTVVGNVHPRDYAIAYLKYVPSSDGKWGYKKRKFERALPYYTVPMLLDTIAYLKEKYPCYVKSFSELGIEMSVVPIDRIYKHYKPEERLREVIEKPKDELEVMAAELAQALADEANIPIGDLGITGSILIGIHKPFSDIDLVVYGRESSLKIKEALKDFFKRPRRGIARLPQENFNALLRERQRLFNLTESEAHEICMRKWNRGLFKSKEFSIHPVKKESEVREVFGEYIYKPIGLATIRGVIADDSESIFMPSKWAIEDVVFIEGTEVNGLIELCSYEGLYMDIVSEGEKFEARGKIEAVYRRGRLSHYRLLIGSPEAKGLDYIKPKP